MVRWRLWELTWGLTLALALGVSSACGGQSTTSNDSDSDAGDAGRGGATPQGGTGGGAGTLDLGGTGGTMATGGTGAVITIGGTGGTITIGGTGGTITTGGTGGTITTGGTGGSVPIGGTSGTGGGQPCFYGGQIYQDGARFTAADGCNTCTCRNGSAGCTLIACPPQGTCQELSEAYARTLEVAKACRPDFEFQCQALVATGLQCGCLTYVGEPAAIDQLGQIGLAWAQRGCSGPITCTDCPREPLGAYCSAEGLCVDFLE